MFNESKNPRVIRSLDEIATATFSLLKEKDYQDITVTEIAKKAGVTRKTFYRNFDSLADVVDYAFYFRMMPLYANSRAENFHDFLLDVFTFAATRKDVLTMFERQKLFPMLSLLALKYLPKSSYLQSVLTSHASDKDFVNYFPTILIGCELGLLEKWTRTGFKESPAELAAINVRALRSMGEEL
jgi:AcrR family transcriptional regulator